MSGGQDYNRADRVVGGEVVRSEELRDGGPVEGTVTDRYVASAPATSVRRETTYRELPDRTRDVEIPEAYNLTRDRVRWGPIWAGLVTALTSLLLLSLLGLAVGLTAIDAERAAREGGVPLSAGVGTAIWGGLSALLAFGLGGWVAGRSAAIFDRGWGALNGALVFLAAVPLILLLASAGVGSILGSLGNYASGLNLDLNQVQQAAQNAQGQATQAGQQTTPAEVGQAAENARNGAWGTVLGLALGLGAATLGGMLGTRRELEVDRRTGDIKD